LENGFFEQQGQGSRGLGMVDRLAHGRAVVIVQSQGISFTRVRFTRSSRLFQTLHRRLDGTFCNNLTLIL